jgi:archaellum component FlaC
MNTDEPITPLSDRQLLEAIRRDLALVSARLSKVESFVDDRSRDTRPMLGEIQREITEMRAEFREEIRDIRHELRMIREDMAAEHKRRVDLLGRVEDLERRPS